MTTGPDIAVTPDDLRELAADMRLAANFAGSAATSVRHGVRLSDLTLAAALDPVGAFAFESAASAVVTGPFGLAGIEARLHRLATSLQQSATDYLDADRVIAESFARVGRTLPRALAEVARPLLGGDIDGAAQALLTADPALADAALAGARPLADLAGGVLLFAEPAAVTVTAVDPIATTGGPPRGLGDVLSQLARLDETRTPGAGEIDIEILTSTASGTHPPPRRDVVVYLAGTDTWTVGSKDVNDLGTNLAAITGASTAYENGVLAALRAAGVTSADHVTLVGHSQGGVVAVNTARDAIESGLFDVTRVITEAAPIGLAARTLPPSVSALAIENSHDLVPELDATPNPPNVTTVIIDAAAAGTDQTITANHELTDGYRSAADQVRASADPAVRAFLDATTGIFGHERTSTTRYRITRGGASP